MLKLHFFFFYIYSENWELNVYLKAFTQTERGVLSARGLRGKMSLAFHHHQV